MDREKLRKGTKLLQKIDDYEYALGCFEWGSEDGGDIVSLLPKIAIEFDSSDGGREVTVLPDIISDDLIEILKTHIESRIEELQKEFDKL